MYPLIIIFILDDSFNMDLKGKDQFISMRHKDDKTIYMCILCQKQLTTKHSARYHLYSAHKKSKLKYSCLQYYSISLPLLAGGYVTIVCLSAH